MIRWLDYMPAVAAIGEFPVLSAPLKRMVRAAGVDRQSQGTQRGWRECLLYAWRGFSGVLGAWRGGCWQRMVNCGWWREDGRSHDGRSAFSDTCWRCEIGARSDSLAKAGHPSLTLHQRF